MDNENGTAAAAVATTKGIFMSNLNFKHWIFILHILFSDNFSIFAGVRRIQNTAFNEISRKTTFQLCLCVFVSVCIPYTKNVIQSDKLQPKHFPTFI